MGLIRWSMAQDGDNERKRAESGEYDTEITHDDILDVFTMVDGPTITSSDVTDEIGCATITARRKLDELHDQGRLRKRTKARRTLWWQPTDSPEQTLKQLSRELDKAIIVGDTVYENGDEHPLSDAESDEADHDE
jgi:predicted ArsR family transcriptional regulator